MHEEIPYHLQRWERPSRWVTISIIVSTVGVFLLQLILQDSAGNDVVGQALSFSDEAWSQGRYWTIFTYAWVHATAIFDTPSLFWLHIAANMIPLFCLGPALEEFLGAWRFLGLYLGGVLASALFWVLITWSGNPDQGIMGASGAIFSLIVAAGTIAPRARVKVYLFFVVPLRMNLRNLAILACGIEAAQMVFGWMPEVAHSVHLGGALFGFLYIMAWKAWWRRRGNIV